MCIGIGVDVDGLFLLLLMLLNAPVVLGDIKSIAIYAMCRSNLCDKSCLPATGCCESMAPKIHHNVVSCEFVSSKEKLHVHAMAQHVVHLNILTVILAITTFSYLRALTHTPSHGSIYTPLHPCLFIFSLLLLLLPFSFTFSRSDIFIVHISISFALCIMNASHCVFHRLKSFVIYVYVLYLWVSIDIDVCAVYILYSKLMIEIAFVIGFNRMYGCIAPYLCSTCVYIFRYSSDDLMCGSSFILTTHTLTHETYARQEKLVSKKKPLNLNEAHERVMMIVYANGRVTKALDLKPLYNNTT